jgi:hypothetical protein
MLIGARPPAARCLGVIAYRARVLFAGRTHTRGAKYGCAELQHRQTEQLRRAIIDRSPTQLRQYGKMATHRQRLDLRR